jgi:hypothetical protein
LSLFQTNAWQRSWWNEWGCLSDVELCFHGHSENSGTFIHSYPIAKVVRIRCLQYVGTSYRKFSTPRTEYNTLAGLSDLSPALKQIESFDWTEAVFSDVKSTSGELQEIQSWARINGWYIRAIREDMAYSIDTTGSFERYLGGLGSNSRLKLYNRRKVFESMGDVVEENFWPNRASEFFELLNDFHRVRWGGPCFSGRSIAFHLEFLGRASSEGIEPHLMVLSSGGRSVSVLYNVRHSGRVYNLQAGYEERFHKKVTLGTLHLGYSIESAFKQSSVNVFDLLAGEGKTTNYKRHLATHQISLSTLMVVRSPFFRFLYRVKDLWGRFRR